MEYISQIEKLLGQKLETEILEGFEPQNNDEPGKPNSNKPKKKNHTPRNKSKNTSKNASQNASPFAPALPVLPILCT